MEWRGFCESTLNARMAFSGVFLQILSENLQLPNPIVPPQGKIKNGQKNFWNRNRIRMYDGYRTGSWHL